MLSRGDVRRGGGNSMESVEWRFYHRTELKDRCGHVTRSRATTLHRMHKNEPIYQMGYLTTYM